MQETETSLQILDKLGRYDRQPFRELLEGFIKASPTQDIDGLIAWAKKTPDRWSQALSILGRLAGFTEKSEVIHSNHILITQLSDHELLRRLKQLEDKIKQVPEAIDITDQSKLEP